MLKIEIDGKIISEKVITGGTAATIYELVNISYEILKYLSENYGKNLNRVTKIFCEGLNEKVLEETNGLAQVKGD